MQYLRLLLLPLTFLYSCIIWLRNKAFNTGLLSSREFKIPVISIGNLAIGGAGKSPMAEYLIRRLQNRYRVAVLSRGYGRKTRGFRIVDANDTSAEAGDEPLQFRKKFPDITVAVSEKRVVGIAELEARHDVVVLDDAFQHRAVKPGLSILLFDYTRINDLFLVLPAGNLREPFSGRQRADVIVVSKCPENLSQEQSETIRKRLKPFPSQRLFYSYLEYGSLHGVCTAEEKPLKCITSQTAVFLLTGIANPLPLQRKLEEYSGAVIHHEYPDHHVFSPKNIAKLAEDFKSSKASEKVIVTTEKDVQRLHPQLLELLNGLPVYYLPVTARIHQPDENDFNNLIDTYVAKYI